MQLAREAQKQGLGILVFVSFFEKDKEGIIKFLEQHFLKGSLQDTGSPRKHSVNSKEGNSVA